MKNENREKVSESGKMTRGMYFSKREKAYIAENVKSKSYSDIAECLAELFPEDNGGHRSKGGVQTYVQRVRKAGESR